MTITINATLVTNNMAAINKAIGKTAGDVAGRSAVKYKATAFDLYFLINPTVP